MDEYGFGLLDDGRVIDLRPMEGGGWPVVFDETTGSWRLFEGTLGAITDSKPLTADEAASLISGEILSQNEVQRFRDLSISEWCASRKSSGK